MTPTITQGIVLSRTDFGEADRIITFLTPDRGKLKAMARGVRKTKSRLAGGIELFSVSQISVIVGRGEITTLISSRLVEHFGHIVKDLDRTNIAYDCLKIINKATEEAADKSYFDLLAELLAGLNEIQLDAKLLQLWFKMRLIQIAGHSPNLHKEESGKKLSAAPGYSFSLENMRFHPQPEGAFTQQHIKLMRVGFTASKPKPFVNIEAGAELAQPVNQIVDAILKTFVRL